MASQPNNAPDPSKSLQASKSSKTATKSNTATTGASAAEVAKLITDAAFQRAAAPAPRTVVRKSDTAASRTAPAAADGNAHIVRRGKFKAPLPTLVKPGKPPAEGAPSPKGIPGKPLQPNRSSQSGQKGPTLQRQQLRLPTATQRSPSAATSLSSSQLGRPASAKTLDKSLSTKDKTLGGSSGNSTLNRPPSSKTQSKSISNKASDVFSREVRPQSPPLTAAITPGLRATNARSTSTAAAPPAAAVPSAVDDAGLLVVESQGLVKQHKQQLSRSSSLSSLDSSDLDDDDSNGVVGDDNEVVQSAAESHASFEHARIRLGLEAGLCVAQELLKGHSHVLQSSRPQHPAAADKLNSAVFLGLDNSIRNPLFSAGFQSSLNTAASSTSTSDLAVATAAAAGSSPVLSAAALSSAAAATALPLGAKVLQDFDLLENPVYKGRSVLQWLAKHSGSGGLGIASSTSGAPPAAAAGSSSSTAGSVMGGASALLPTYYRLQQQLSVDPRAQSSVSVDSSQLSAIIRERISTDQLSILTEVAPDTSRFSSTRNSSRSAASAAAHDLGSTLRFTPGETLDELEIEYSQDGQGDHARSPLNAASGDNEGRGTLQPGDFVYEMLPAMAHQILSWSGVEGVTGRMSSFGSIGTMGTLNDTYRTAGLLSMTGTAAAAAGLGAAMGSSCSSPRGLLRGQSADMQPWQLLLSKQRHLPGGKWPALDDAAAAATIPGSAAVDEDRLAKLAIAEHHLREHGLLESYLSSTSAALLGAQAALIRAISISPNNSRRQTAAAQEPQGDKSIGTAAAAALPAAAVAAAQELGKGSAADGGGGVRGLMPSDSKRDRRRLAKQISRRMKKEVWLPPANHNPLPLIWSPLGVITCIAYLAAAVYYFYIRIAYSMDMGFSSWYGAVVFACEVVGFTSVVPYGLMLLRRCHYRGEGLPMDDGRWKLPKPKRFSVRVLIPCYKEDLDTIKETVNAALTADLPPSCSRVVYLCDDGKDAAKAAYIAGLGDAAVYVSGRVRKPGEINGRAANLNNCLKNVIYADHLNGGGSRSGSGDGDGDADEGIPPQEVVVVLDADMVCKTEFFRKVLEVMWDNTVGLCLTPQSFSNIPQACDVWNHINVQFWEYIMPGCDALGYVGCTGTNFCIRATALNKAGWFPEYTITEDYALSMELKVAGVRGRYLPQYLAVGEAPEDIRSVLQQRSRWCKGHMQVFFSRKCPLIHPKLNMLHRILYTNGTWAYFATIITTCIYTLVPFISLVWGIHPVSLSSEFTLAATLNFAAGAMVNFHVQKISHLQGMWLSLISNHLLAFTYFKAVVNTLLSLAGWKKRTGFKATNKTGAAALTAAAGNMLLSTMRAVSQFSVTVGHRMAAVRYKNRPVVVGLQDTAAAAAAAVGSRAEVADQQPLHPQQEQHVRRTAGLDMPIAEAKESDEAPASAAADNGTGAAAAAAATVAAAADAAAQAMLLAGFDMSETQKPAAVSAAESKSADVTATPTAVVIAIAEEPKPASSKSPCCWPICCRKSPKPPKQQSNKSHWYDWMLSNAEGLGRHAKGSKLDAWWLLLSLGISLTAVIAGLYQIAARGERYDLGSVPGLREVFSAGQLHEFMLLALLLAGINAISPLMFFIYFCTKGRVLKVATYTGQTLNSVLFVGAVIVLWLLTPTVHNLPQALRLLTNFLSAQRVTTSALLNTTNTLPAWQQLPAAAVGVYPWLSGSVSTGNDADLVQGGYYMSGDFVKQTHPLATNMAMLAWSMMAFKNGYDKAGVFGDLQNNLRVGAQYLMDCHIAPELYVAQIGNLSDYQVNLTTGTGFWGLPQGMPPDRAPIIINASTVAGGAGAEVLAAASAALSAASIALKPSEPDFAAAALVKAQLLFDLAKQMRPQVNQTLDKLRELADSSSSSTWGGSGNESAAAAAAAVGVEVFSSSSVMDDLAFAATWLAKATGGMTLLDKAHSYLTTYWEQDAPWSSAAAYWPSHDNMAWAAAVLLLQQPVMPDTAAVVVAARHREALSLMFRGWLNGRNNWTDVTIPSPAGFPWVSHQPLPTAAATSLLGLLWAAGDPGSSSSSSSSVSRAGRLSDAVKHRLQCFGLHQATYILGRSRGSISYVVGYGSRFPLRPQHRLASCSGVSNTSSCSVSNGLMTKTANPVVLQGALVAGPAADDSYDDIRTYSLQSSVGLQHNIPLIGLLGGLMTSGITQGQCSAGEGLFQMLTVNELP